MRYEEASNGVKGDSGYRCLECDVIVYGRRAHDAEAHSRTDVDALTAVITAERVKHRNLGPERHVFSIVCVCGYNPMRVSVKNEFEHHVDEAIARAIIKNLALTQQKEVQ